MKRKGANGASEKGASEKGANEKGAYQKPLSKKRRKKLVRMLQQGRGSAQQYVDIYGKNARASLELKIPPLTSLDGFLSSFQSIAVTDVRDLVLWVLMGNSCTAIGTFPQWIFIKNKPLIDQVAVFFVEDFRPTDALPFLSSLEHGQHKAIPTRMFSQASSCTSCLQTLLTVQIKMKQNRKKKKTDPQGSSTAPVPPQETLPPSFYVLSQEQLLDNDYPQLPLADSYKRARGLAAGEELPEHRSLLGLDCEMCRTTKGLELTRITVIDQKHQLVMDQLVKPANPIVDYCTRYSGITAELLQDITCTLSSVQDELLAVVRAETILVGHSLGSVNLSTYVATQGVLFPQNDLRALKLYHDQVIDTSLLYPHPAGPPMKSSLKYLTRGLLQRTIQDGDAGHNSKEDAVAALELAQLKISKGPSFDLTKRNTNHRIENIFKLLEDNSKRCAMIDSAPNVGVYSGAKTNCFPRSSNADVVKCALQQFKRREVPFVFAHLHGNEHCNSGSDSDPSENGRDDIIDSLLKQVYDGITEKTLLLLVTQPSTRAVQRFKQTRTASSTKSAPESPTHTLANALEEAKTGITFAIMRELTQD